MGSMFSKATSNITAIPRKLKIIPEETATPQGIVDLARGKKKPKSSSFFGKPIAQFGRTSKRFLQ